MTSKYKRVIVAVRGDTQGGHSGGLLNPETDFPDIALDESGRRVVTGFSRRELRPIQKKLWEWHEDARNQIGRLAGKDDLIFLELGDMTQGNTFTDNLAEAELNAQVIIARYNMIPWMRMRQIKKVRVTKGTGVHVWGNGATETVLVHWLADAYPKVDIAITDHWVLDVDGYLIDVAHHGAGPGIRNWTKGNVFDLYIKSKIRDALDRNEAPPNMVLRGHFHEFTYGLAKHQIDEHIYKAEGYIIPPMCFIGAHAQKVIKSPDRMSLGMMALEIVNGKLLDAHHFIHSIDLRTFT